MNRDMAKDTMEILRTPNPKKRVGEGEVEN